jgi:Cu/Ag efflux protein CusF
MRKLQVSLLVAIMVLALTSLAAAKQAASTPKDKKPGAVAVEVLKLTATVKAVDAQKKTVTLEGKGGKTFTLNAKNARNLEQVKVGDKVKAEYVEELAIFVRKADAPPEVKGEQTVALAPKGKMPGGVMAETTEIQANVEGIDRKKRTITLKGPAGAVQSFKVGKQVKNFKEVKKGDQVVLRVTEALALTVEKP